MKKAVFMKIIYRSSCRDWCDGVISPFLEVCDLNTDKNRNCIYNDLNIITLPYLYRG